MTDGAGQAGAELGRSELVEDVGPLARVRRLRECTFEIRLGDVPGTFPACATCGFAQGRDDGGAAPRRNVEEVGGDTLGRCAGLREELRRSLMAELPLGAAKGLSRLEGPAR